jgi:major vault protein
MAEERTRERDLVLGPNEYSYVRDETKGNVNIYCGSYKASLSQTDQPVILNKEGKFVPALNLDVAKQQFVIVKQNNYVVLENPEINGLFPKTGTVSNSSELKVGKKVNIAGPTTFPLWPGQIATVIEGHKLKSNQFLVVRVYSEEEAKENWNKSIISSENDSNVFDVKNLRIGKLFIIKGTDVSFYIPPTGIEVVKDSSGEYIRNAVTLERLEYCILLDENGNKRFEKGPAVVFPTSTETFIERDESPKLKAVELNDVKAIYVKVIAPYVENTVSYEEGQELLITGKDQKFYFPRAEHAIIKYGKNEVQFAVTIPSGEGRYVLDRNSGDIRTVKGPQVFLPDPRKEILIKRILTESQVGLWFPGNQKAKDINSEIASTAKAKYNNAKTTKPYQRDSSSVYASPSELNKPVEVESFGSSKKSSILEDSFSDAFNRSTTYAPPPSISLDTKYEGAVMVDVWPGYAVQVKNKTGNKRIEVGPVHLILDFDETLEEIYLPNGIKTVFLPIKDNSMMIQVFARTSDNENVIGLVSVQYDFMSENDWFKTLDLHSLMMKNIHDNIRTVISTKSSTEMYSSDVEISEDYLTLFSNGMKINSIKIEDVKFENNKLVLMFKDSIDSLRLLELEKQTSKTKAEKETLILNETKAKIANELDLIKSQKELVELRAELESLKLKKQKESDFEKANNEKELETLKVERDSIRTSFEAEKIHTFNALNADALMKEVQAYVEKAKAISPELAIVLKEASNKNFVAKLTENLGLEALMKDTSIVKVMENKLGGVELNDILKNLKVVS